jgi:hypothetical protein
MRRWLFAKAFAWLLWASVQVVPGATPMSGADALRVSSAVFIGTWLWDRRGWLWDRRPT